MEATQPQTMKFADGTVLPVDLDGDPYRNDSLGPWKVTRCCGAYATDTDGGIACKGCWEFVFDDGPARLAPTHEVRAVAKDPAEDMSDGAGIVRFIGSADECDAYAERNESPDNPERYKVVPLAEVTA